MWSLRKLKNLLDKTHIQWKGIALYQYASAVIGCNQMENIVLKLTVKTYCEKNKTRQTTFMASQRQELTSQTLPNILFIHAE